MNDQVLEVWASNPWLLGLAAASCVLAFVGKAGKLVKPIDWGLFIGAHAAIFIWFGLGAPAKINLHDFHHYRLGAIYLNELGYRQLYPCAIAATPPELRPKTWRNQETYLQETWSSDWTAACQKNLGSRWPDFVKDVDWLRTSIGSEAFQGFLDDHGFNPPPFWAVVYKPYLEALGRENVDRINFTNVALMFATLWVMAWGWGLRSASVAFCLILCFPLFQSSWINGSPFRLDWFFATMAGLALWARGMLLRAACCFGFAGAIRVFPLLGFLFVLAAEFLFMAGASRRDGEGLSLKARLWACGKKILPAGIVACLFAGLLSLAGLLAFGWERLPEFVSKMALHSTFVSWNRMGAAPVANGVSLMFFSGQSLEGAVWAKAFQALQILAFFVAAWAVGAKSASKDLKTRAALSGCAFGMVAWAGPGLANYYWILLVCYGPAFALAPMLGVSFFAGAVVLATICAALPQQLYLLALASSIGSILVYAFGLLASAMLYAHAARFNREKQTAVVDKSSASPANEQQKIS